MGLYYHIYRQFLVYYFFTGAGVVVLTPTGVVCPTVEGKLIAETSIIFPAVGRHRTARLALA
jgi:hypothetical protein